MDEKQSSRTPWGKEVVVAHDNKDSLVSQGLRQDVVGKAQSMQEESHEAKEEIEKETEEKSNRDFTVPEGMHALPRPSKLNKEVVGLLITKHFGDFGWGQGKIKSYNSKRKFPFEIKWSDELRPRFHQLTIDEYVETERKEGSKAGDFTIFTKDS